MSNSGPLRQPNASGALPTLKPQQAMPRNAGCWCLSGRKFKQCHLLRESEEPRNAFAAAAEAAEAYANGYCSHPKASPTTCEGKVIAAHTVQRRGGLALIEEAGHVLTTKATYNDIARADGQPSPRRVGVGSASTFLGFCSRHDSELFKPIEQKRVTIDPHAAFLLSYRAVAYERFFKVQSLKVYDMLRRSADRGRSFSEQSDIQQWLFDIRLGVELGCRDINKWKGAYDERLLSGDLTGFHFRAIQFDRVLPLVACGAFYPESDFGGAPLQQLTNNHTLMQMVAVNMTAFEGYSVIVLGWFGDANEPAALFADSFARVPDDRKSAAVFRMCFEMLENTMVRPSWWNGLDGRMQQVLKRRMRSGTPMEYHDVTCLTDDGLDPAPAAALASTQG